MSPIGKWILERAVELNNPRTPGLLVVDLSSAPQRFRGDRRYNTVAIFLGINVMGGS